MHSKIKPNFIITAMKATCSTRMLAGSILNSQLSARFFRTALPAVDFGGVDRPTSIGHGAVRFAATKSGGGAKKSGVHRLLYQAEERYRPGGDVEPIPQITLDHVTISCASSGSGGHNKAVKTRVDMRFDVTNAHWLNERVRERIMQMEKNQINRDGEIVLSKKIMAQRSKSEDAAAKLKVLTRQQKKLQAIIDAASYVPKPLPPKMIEKITELSALAEEKQQDKKRSQSQIKVL